MAWIAVDFDHTLIDTPTGKPIKGALDALEQLRELGHKIVIHSCNNPLFIRQWLAEREFPFDAIWGESPIDEGAKPVAAVYIDDRAVAFRGNWNETLRDTLTLIRERPKP